MSDLLNRCLQGDADAWSDFVERYAPVIHGAVRRVIDPRAQTDPTVNPEDVTQEVFVRLLRNDARLLRSYDPTRASLATWLTIVSRSTALDVVRKRSVPTVPWTPEVRPRAPDAPAPSSSPTNEVPADLLSARQRLVLHLLFDEERETPEVARILGVEQQTVRSTKHKALLKLREYFERRTPPGPDS